MRSLIVIPARHGSTRFPGKPLVPIAGVPLILRVGRIAALAAREAGADYTVATDDARIETFCRQAGLPVVMTPAELASGTDRAFAAARQWPEPPDFVVNLQGDAPFTPPGFIARMIAVGAESDADVVTPVMPLTWAELDRLREMKVTTPFSGTTCVTRADGRALWFSKQILPAMRKEESLRRHAALSPVKKHLGLYGYRMAALAAYTRLPVSPQEALEGLEQLRFLENGLVVQTFEVAAPKITLSGIDTPEDAARAEALIAEHGEPEWMLEPHD